SPRQVSFLFWKMSDYGVKYDPTKWRVNLKTPLFIQDLQRMSKIQRRQLLDVLTKEQKENKLVQYCFRYMDLDWVPEFEEDKRKDCQRKMRKNDKIATRYCYKPKAIDELTGMHRPRLSIN
ncbi:MAG: hypothetical protein KDE30_13185, partial [Novosphingobium sp.]|nr:hypothetical protein [Novosphingobium sp.]